MKDELNLDELEKDKFGFPLLGPIIRAYRQQMTYTDENGEEKHWTQGDLAKKLDVSEVTVRLMELQNKGLGSIERRRVLCDLLKIPPALLGLATIPQLEAVFKGPTVSNVITSKHAGISSETITGYKDALGEYNGLFADRTIRASIGGVEHFIAQITTDVENARLSQAPLLQRILYDFHVLAAKTYGYDLCDWMQASTHLEESLVLAMTLDNPDLQARSLFLTGKFYLGQEKPLLAKVPLDGALKYAKSGEKSTLGAVSSRASITTALTATDMASRLTAERLLEQAEKEINTADESTIFQFNKAWYMQDRAELYIALGRYGRALVAIEGAEDLEVKKRELEWLSILRAECYVKQRSSDLEEATRILLQVVANNATAKEQYHLKRVGKLYRILSSSMLGNSPAVVQLGLNLRQLQR